ncbi:MAG TPA: hypothetical protein PKD50_09565, partial [Leptospiraceae bacterium]|nr:hypothetical protein [Leptospiraceae bacterium]
MKLQKNFLQKIFSTIKRPFFLLVLFIIFILSFQCSSSEKKTFPEKAYDEEKGSSSPMSPSDSDRKKSKELDKKNPKEEKTVDAKPTSVSEKSESGLKAGYADDNKQFNLFLNFLDKFKSSAAHIDLDVKERIIFFVKDKNSRSIPNASI